MPAEGLDIRIRLALTGDGPRCAEIFLHGRRKAFPWQPEDRFWLDDYYDCVEGEDVLVAEVGGTVVGFVSIDAPERFIHNLFIDPAWRGRGIGSALLREALLLLQGSAQLACAARNAAARAFYEHNGWIPVPNAQRGGAADPLVTYQKSAL